MDKESIQKEGHDGAAEGPHGAADIAQSQTPTAVAPSRRLPNPWVAVLLVISSFLVATVLAQLIVSIYPALKHWTVSQTQHWLDSSTIAQFGYTLLAYGLIAAPIVLYLKRKKLGFSVVGLKQPRWRDPAYGLLALPLYFISYGVLLSVVSKLLPSLNVEQKQQIGFSGTSGGFALILTFLSLAVIPPLVEEFVMRGFLFSSLRARLKLPLAVVITSVLFAVGHLQFGSGAPLLWVAAIDTFVLSLFLIYLRQKTDSLWASITLHAAKNSLAFVYIFLLHKG